MGGIGAGGWQGSDGGGVMVYDCGMDELLADLAAEHDDLDRRVAALDEQGWRTMTPAVGWDVADSISHLWYFDERAVEALTDPERFLAHAAEMIGGGGSTEDSVVAGRQMQGDELLTAWRAGRAELLDAARPLDPKARVPWYGPPMSARSFITARLMETWAHGVDVADGLGQELTSSPRLKHVAHIAIGARPYSYIVHHRPVPDDELYVELKAGDDAVWTWGNAEAPAWVRGSALEFCLVTTQRRNVADTSMASGGSATEWLTFAQAFAGGPGAGRLPLG